MTPSEVRWTRSDCILEIPVPEGNRYRQVVLFGILPEQMKKRNVRVTVEEAAADHSDLIGETWIQSSQFDSHSIELSGPIPSVIHRLRIDFEDYWVPKEHGLGEDPRKLGFYLDGVGLK